MYTEVVFDYIKRIGQVKYLPIGLETEQMKNIIDKLNLNLVISQLTVEDFAKELEGWGRSLTKIPNVHPYDKTIVNIPLAYALSKIDWMYIANSLLHHYKNMKPNEHEKKYFGYTSEENYICSNYVLFNSLNDQLKHNVKAVSRRILRPLKETGSCYLSLMNYLTFIGNMNHILYIPSVAIDLIEHFYLKCDYENIVNNKLQEYCSKYINHFMIFYQEKELKHSC